MPESLYDMLELKPLDDSLVGVHRVESTIKKHVGRIDNVLIFSDDNYVPVDFLVLDIECNVPCPVILRRLFLHSVGAIIDMKEEIIRF